MERSQQIHGRRNITRFGEMRGMKQETRAYELDEDWTQKKVSHRETKEKNEANIMEQVAKILNVSLEAIRHLNEDAAINIISSTLNDQAGSVHYNFNPRDKLNEAYAENIKLYERLIDAEEEKVADLEQLSKNK